MFVTKPGQTLRPRQQALDFGPFTSKGVIQRFYDNVNLDLDKSEVGDDAYFMNLGYLHDGSPSFSVERLDSRSFDRESHQLFLEVIGDCPMDGKAVLDVGCGRGGAAHVLKQHFHVNRYVGVDISEQAISFCNRIHKRDNYHFYLGDAESLQLPHNTFDVLLNVESSHNYPNICAFYLQANRVLKPGGHFLYADSMQEEAMARNVERIRQAGFEILRQLDITENVMRACRAVANKRKRLHTREGMGAYLSNFVAAPGSEAFGAFRRGELQYWLFKLRKDPT